MDFDFLETDDSDDDFDINPVFPHDNEEKIKKEEILMFQSKNPKTLKIRENGLPQIVFCNNINYIIKRLCQAQKFEWVLFQKSNTKLQRFIYILQLGFA